MGVLKTKPLNIASFIRFSNATGVTISGGNVTSSIQVDDDDPLPRNNFIRGNASSYRYCPPIIYKDTLPTYFTLTLQDGTFGSGSGIIVNESTGIAIPEATITFVRFNGNKSIFGKIEYTGSTNPTISQIGRIFIGDKVSNPLTFVGVTSYKWPVIKYSEQTDWYDFPYSEDVTLGSYSGKPFNQIRFGGNMVGSTYPTDNTQYRNVTDSKIRVLKQVVDKEYDIKTYMFDYYAHEAFAIAINHSTLKINDIDMVLGSGSSYDTENTDLLPISNGGVSLIDSNFTRKNKPCPTITTS